MRLPFTITMTIGLLAGTIAVAATPVYHTGTTRKIMQLTGERDQTLRMPTLNRTESRFGVVGTDLGSSLEHNGRLVFLFGDTFGRPGDTDSFAFSDATSPWNLILDFPLDNDRRFLPIRVPAITQGAFCVPTGGISANDAIYVVYTTDWDANAGNMTRSVMIRSHDDGRTWTLLYDISRATTPDPFDAKFINVALARDPASDTRIYAYGSGAYRKSSPHLAAIPGGNLDSPANWRYFAGTDATGGPRWSLNENDAASLFDHPVIGEFSCAWIPPLARWVMLYNSGQPRGILMRTAELPWGPFSQPQVIFDPGRDDGYGHFMHANWDVARRDNFHDPGRERDWGGEYGPYLIPRFANGDQSRCEIFYTMSTWNPYQVVLMRSTVGTSPPSESGTRAESTTIPGDPSWNTSRPDFLAPFTRDAIPHVTTYRQPPGDAVTGVAWRWLPRDDANESLRFSVHGGHAELLLLEGPGDIPLTATPAAILAALKSGKYGRVVESATGLDDNDTVVPVTWSLRKYDRPQLKVVLIDALEEPWGFLSVSAMTLMRRVD